jgi:hypothetical protein
LWDFTRQGPEFRLWTTIRGPGALQEAGTDTA